MEVEFIYPAGADDTDALDMGLVTLTQAICQVHPELEGGYGLGGKFGYGENFENDVFAMRRFYWGECDCGYDALEEAWSETHKHSADCYQTELEAMKRAAKLPFWDGKKWHHMDDRDYDAQRAVEDEIYTKLCAKHGKDREFGAAVHCSCDHEPAWTAWSEANTHKPECSLTLPNFLHKKTGFEVRWYKYIGRGTETKNAEGVDLQAVFSESIASLQR